MDSERTPRTLRVASREPKVFISFKHNRQMLWVATRLKTALEQRFVEVYRLIDDPRTGALFSDQIREGIASSDGLVALWSPLGSAAHYVKMEYRIARELGRPVALARSNNAPLPPDWNRDERFETLDNAVSWPRGLFARNMDPSFRLGGDWNALADRLAEWARSARDGTLPPHRPGGQL